MAAHFAVAKHNNEISGMHKKGFMQLTTRESLRAFERKQKQKKCFKICHQNFKNFADLLCKTVDDKSQRMHFLFASRLRFSRRFLDE